MKPLYYWIKERHNPQLGIYYVPMGQMKIKDAREYEKAMYGYNYMHKFKTKDEYEAEIERLKNEGERIN